MPRPDDLTSHEIEEMKNALDAERVPEDLKGRVVGVLKREGLLSSRSATRKRSRWAELAVAAMIAMIAFLAGMALQRPSGDAAPTEATMDDRETYILLLRESEESSPASSEEVERLVSEYGAWAREKSERGQLVGGEKLDVDGWVLSPEGDSARQWQAEEGFVGGFFLVKATSYEKAAEIASTCPHLLYGGTIEIRRIDPT